MARARLVVDPLSVNNDGVGILFICGMVLWCTGAVMPILCLDHFKQSRQPLVLITLNISACLCDFGISKFFIARKVHVRLLNITHSCFI